MKKFSPELLSEFNRAKLKAADKGDLMNIMGLVGNALTEQEAILYLKAIQGKDSHWRVKKAELIPG
jgi:hypothetical protein